MLRYALTFTLFFAVLKVKANNSDGVLHTSTTTTLLNMNTTSAPIFHRQTDDETRWVLAATAGPTVFIFVLGSIIIHCKNVYSDRKEDSEKIEPEDIYPIRSFSPNVSFDEKPKIIETTHKKKKVNEDIYTNMLERFKADKSKSSSFTAGRKSSQIRLEGINAQSPKNIARKHLILGQLNETIYESGQSKIVDKLIATSTEALVGPKLWHLSQQDSVDKAACEHIQSFIERSKEDIRASCQDVLKILPEDCRNLLPEDLEEAFRNFTSWQESLL